MIEIIDLEADFIRAPIHMLLDKITKQIGHYFNLCMTKHHKAQSALACLSTKADIDNMQSPFDVTDRYLKILHLLNSSVEIARFSHNRGSSVGQVARQLNKGKVYSPNSLEYHLEKERQEKLDKQLKSKQYQV